MHVYGELSGTLTSAGHLHGTLVGDHHKIQGTLTITGTATGGVDGDNLEYGLTDATSSLVGVGEVGSMIIE